VPNPFPPFAQLTSKDYQVWQQLIAPTALQDATGTLFEAALASAKDWFSDRVRLALKSRLPQLAPFDALTQIGIERGMPQGLTESGTAYAARLQDAWNAWPWAGTAYGLLHAFFGTGYTNVVIAQVRGGKEFTLDINGALQIFALANGLYETDPLSPLAAAWGSFSWSLANYPSPLWNGFNWAAASYPGAAQAFWSKFDVIFPAPLPASWVSGGVPSTSSSEASFIRSLIAAWKPAQATNNRIVIVLSGRVWGYTPTELWGGFSWTPGLPWGAFNWGPSSTYTNGNTYASPAYAQFGSPGATWGGSSTVNWSA